MTDAWFRSVKKTSRAGLTVQSDSTTRPAPPGTRCCRTSRGSALLRHRAVLSVETPKKRVLWRKPFANLHASTFGLCSEARLPPPDAPAAGGGVVFIVGRRLPLADVRHMCMPLVSPRRCGPRCAEARPAGGERRNSGSECFQPGRR